jgi:hypothetical protein
VINVYIQQLEFCDTHVDEEVGSEDETTAEEGSTDDASVVGVERSSAPISELLGVTSLMKEYAVVGEEAGVETVDEVKVVVVGVLI